MRLAALLCLSLLAADSGAVSWQMSGSHRGYGTATVVASTVVTCASLGGIHNGYVRMKLSGVAGKTLASASVTATDGTTTVRLVDFYGVGAQTQNIVDKTHFFVTDLALTSITLTAVFTGTGLSGTAELECVGS